MSLKPFFCIVGRGDTPIFETSFGNDSPSDSQKDDIVQLILQASLDVIEQRAAGSSAMVFRNVDSFSDMNVSSVVTATGATLLLLHNSSARGSDVTSFLETAYEAYVTAFASPFAELTAALPSAALGVTITAAARRYGIAI